MKLGIMGGTFDPVHLGHLDCARVAQRELGLDEVVFMPSAITNFKQGRKLASARHRLAMCELAVRDEASWSVSDAEVLRGGTTYTVDTLRELHYARPLDELFFLASDDMLCTIDRWRESSSLAELAVFVAVHRPGIEIAQERLTALRALGFDIRTVENVGYDISSTEIRRRIACHEDMSDMVPPTVADYIRRHALYTR